MRIVVETNVIVSALVFGDAPREVMELALASASTFYFSPAIRAEVDEVLAEKFGWFPKEIATRTRALWNFGNKIEPGISPSVVIDNPDDDRVPDCAVAAEADVSVSEDRKHLLPLGSFRSIPIQSPREFLDSKAWEAMP